MAKLKELENKARILRKHIIKMTCAAGSGHPGGSLSAADIVAALYFHELRLDPSRPDWPDRDRFVLSKGHAAPVLYAALAERGFFPVEELLNLRKLGSRLQGHPDMRKVPGVEMSTGSLGQGLSAANGMALAARLDRRDYRVYVLLGDGEIQEGQIWEASMAAAVYKASNLTAIIDWNGVQATSTTAEIFPIANLVEKWKAFGWNVIEIDGHDMVQVLGALDAAKAYTEGPTAILAHTIKGKCFPFAEGKAKYHNAAMNDEEYKIAWQCIENMKREVEA